MGKVDARMRRAKLMDTIPQTASSAIEVRPRSRAWRAPVVQRFKPADNHLRPVGVPTTYLHAASPTRRLSRSITASAIAASSGVWLTKYSLS